MARTETVIITNMCMVYNNGKVLVQDRVDPNWRGLTFPGGHVDKGESFTDAVIREVFWTDLDNLSKLPLAKDMEDMLKVFLDDTLSEFFYYQEDGNWKYMLK